MLSHSYIPEHSSSNLKATHSEEKRHTHQHIELGSFHKFRKQDILFSRFPNKENIAIIPAVSENGSM
jgi:hypothetical protein